MTTIPRADLPEGPDYVPDGYEYVWTPDEDWILVADDEHKCRGARACPRKIVAKLKRRHFIWSRREYVDRWYGYCDKHLYGHRIEDGRIMSRVLRPVVPS